MVGLGLAGMAGGARASEVLVTTDIATSTTWTADNLYNLQNPVYVLPGATLTIEAGTILASDTNIGGLLSVCKGAQIIAQGTQQQPIVMTSKADYNTWTNGDPRTGFWREATNEWGGLQIMGAGYISANNHGGATSNVPYPDPNNTATMEGLIAAFPGDTRVLYGGGNDDDDSGTLTYVSIRYDGKVIALNNELNGLSLGGIGRSTTVHHIDIMNPVDDAIEIWGGALNLKYLNVWNQGDDGFDTDEGWRGKAQFGLIVQGYCIDATRGGGVSDNCFETDGAEDSDWQPVSTECIYNFTCIGQPSSARKGCAFRDNARAQYRNCIFMDVGQEVVKNDNSDGDGAHGYGYNGTLTFDQTWQTAYNSYSGVNAPPNPADFYKAQTDGNLIDVKDCVYFRNQYVNGGTDAYTTANAEHVFDASNNNVKVTSILDADGPIVSLVRGSPVTKGGLTVVPVSFLDPRPQNDALTSVNYAPYDKFFTSAHYRGAFAPGCNWLAGWTACEAFGFTPVEDWGDLGLSLTGVTGDPVLAGSGTAADSSTVDLLLTNAAPDTTAFLIIGVSQLNLPFAKGTLVPNVDLIYALPTDDNGELDVSDDWPSGIPAGTLAWFQYLILDPAAPKKISFSNALVVTAE
jgi:hypothetical protein